MSLRKKLLQGDKEIVIFGAGYIGYSTAAFFARKGVASTIIDIDPQKIEIISQGRTPYKDMETWIGFDVKPFNALIKATSDWLKVILRGNPVYFISVNTEKDGEPWDNALSDVCSKIAKDPGRPLVIVESTLAPNWTDNIMKPILGSRAKIAVAPRRDWFTLPGMTVETLDRVVGATSKKTLGQAISVLSIISTKIHSASSHRVSELVKAVENAYRNIGIMLGYEISLAYLNTNIREVLRLCGTKWNVDEYYPSIGIGGYCIPIAPKYVLSGTEIPIQLFHAAMDVDRKMPRIIAYRLFERGIRTALILGISYKGNLKVHIASPGLRLADALMDQGIKVSIHDPLYSREELEQLSNASPVDYPNSTQNIDCIIVACDHDQYKAIPKEKLYETLEGCKRILDCIGIWAELKDKFKTMGIEYHLVGDENWL